MEGARAAMAADLPRLAELRQLALDEMRPVRGGLLYLAREARPELDASAGEALWDDDRGAWVGTIDDVVVGYAMARVEHLRTSELLGVIDALFVEEGAREVGVGEALMGELLRWCAERGCAAVDAVALPGARATKNFFEESGFTARLLVMHRRLD
jgi:GNAT superfamily N-acetyltransferase